MFSDRGVNHFLFVCNGSCPFVKSGLTFEGYEVVSRSKLLETRWIAIGSRVGEEGSFLALDCDRSPGLVPEIKTPVTLTSESVDFPLIYTSTRVPNR